MLADQPVIWRPNAGPQTDFLSDACDWVLYGGAAGGGKSDALLADALGQISDGKYQAILFRKSYPDLEELIARSKDIYPACGGRWNKTEKTWTFPSGATIKFRYIERDDDARNYQGHQYQWIGFDELTHFTQWQWWYLRSRNRPRAPGQRCYMRASCNPDGKGLQWVKAMFVDVATPGQVVVRDIKDPVTGDVVKIRQRFIPAKLSDNPTLARSGYGATLASLPEADRKALLDGDWNAYVGSVFKFDSVHLWSWDRFKQAHGSDKIPKEWTRFRLMDWGYAHPFCVSWFAMNNEGVAYLYREWYGVEVGANGIKADTGIAMAPTVAAKRIKSIEDEAAEKIATGWTGPDLNSAGTGDTSAGIKRAEYFQAEKVFFDYWTAGPDSRKAKKSALHERLYYKTNEAGEVIQRPGLVILQPRSTISGPGIGELSDGGKHTIRTVPALEYDPAKGGEDIDTDMEDHAYDALSAFCLMRPWTPRPADTLPDWAKRQHGSGWKP